MMAIFWSKRGLLSEWCPEFFSYQFYRNSFSRVWFVKGSLVVRSIMRSFAWQIPFLQNLFVFCLNTRDSTRFHLRFRRASAVSSLGFLPRFNPLLPHPPRSRELLFPFCFPVGPWQRFLLLLLRALVPSSEEEQYIGQAGSPPLSDPVWFLSERVVSLLDRVV